MGLVPLSPTRIVLAPHYEQIRQFGLDAQLTVEAWLLKLEAIYRQGARNAVRKLTDPSFLGNKEAYAAFVVGGEYTFNGVFGTDADLSLLAEWMIDGRRRRATNQYQTTCSSARALHSTTSRVRSSSPAPCWIWTPAPGP